jgi:hypothetical protein
MGGDGCYLVGKFYIKTRNWPNSQYVDNLTVYVVQNELVTKSLKFVVCKYDYIKQCIQFYLTV